MHLALAGTRGGPFEPGVQPAPRAGRFAPSDTAACGHRGRTGLALCGSMTVFAAQDLSKRDQDLSELLALAEQLPLGLPSVLQAHIVIDANVVLGDVRWVVTNARDRSARTKVFCAMKSRVLVCYAPTFMTQEVEKHLPRVAEDAGVPLAEVSSVWGEYRELIRFVDAGEPGTDEDVRDAKDVPYVALAERIGTAVLSRDLDIAAMGADTIDFELVGTLREYGRTKGVQLTISIAGRTSVLISFGALRELALMLAPSLKAGAARVPPAAWAALAVALSAALLHKPSRDWITSKLVAVGNSAGSAALFFAPLLTEYRNVERAARLLEEQISSQSPHNKWLEPARRPSGDAPAQP